MIVKKQTIHGGISRRHAKKGNRKSRRKYGRGKRERSASVVSFDDDEIAQASMAAADVLEQQENEKREKDRALMHEALDIFNNKVMKGAQDAAFLSMVEKDDDLVKRVNTTMKKMSKKRKTGGRKKKSKSVKKTKKRLHFKYF